MIKSYTKDYLISCFYYPQGFFTSVKQNYARKNTLPIDQIVIDTVFDNPEKQKLVYDYGFNIYGFVLEGAKMNDETFFLEEL